MTEEKTEKKLTSNISKGVTRAVGLDKPHKTIEIPAGHMGVEILGDDGQIEIQKPPDSPYTLQDYSKQLVSSGHHKQAEELNQMAEAALTKEGKKMAEDFQLIKRKEFINAETDVAEKATERKEETEKEERRRKSRALAAEYNRRQEAGEDLTEFHGNIDPNSDLAQQNAGMQIAMRPKLAVNVMRVQLPLEVMDELNDHIDETIIPNNVDYSQGLVGQIRQNEKSKI